MTIHKCQGLSLDCAIVDLSDKVFADGMAYVALSRLKSSAGLHTWLHLLHNLLRLMLKEVNRLRQEYRTDLPLHDVSVSSAATKYKLRALSDIDEPLAKRQHTTKKFHSVDDQWQRDACVLLGLNFEGSNAMEKCMHSIVMPTKN